MLSNSINWLIGSAILAMCVISVGCCGPQGCGVGCGALAGGCNDCDGAYYGARPAPCGPIDQLRQLKRSLVCGGGCGETYYGEWISTPPDAKDPCYGNQFVGGATKCTPFCNSGCRPGLALAAGLYGKRFCDGTESCGCDSCEVSYGETYVDSGPVYSSGPVSGCSTCDLRSSGIPAQTRVANNQVMMTEQQWLARQQMQETTHLIQDSGHGNQIRTARAVNTNGRVYK